MTSDRDPDRDVWDEYRRRDARDDLSRGVGQGVGFGIGCVVAVIGLFAVGSLLLILVFAIGFGGGSSLGSLQDDCANGDMPACDRLFLESPIFSAEERFGASCGERVPLGQLVPCAQLFP